MSNPCYHLDPLVYHSPRGRLLSVALGPAWGRLGDIIKWNGWNITNMIDTLHHIVLHSALLPVPTIITSLLPNNLHSHCAEIRRSHFYLKLLSVRLSIIGVR